LIEKLKNRGFSENLFVSIRDVLGLAPKSLSNKNKALVSAQPKCLKAPKRTRFLFRLHSIDKLVSLMLLAELLQILDTELFAVNDCGIAFIILDFGISERYSSSKICLSAPDVPCLLPSQNQLEPLVVYLQALHGLSSNAILLITLISLWRNTDFSTFQRLTYLPSYSIDTIVKPSETFWGGLIAI